MQCSVILRRQLPSLARVFELDNLGWACACCEFFLPRSFVIGVGATERIAERCSGYVVIAGSGESGVYLVVIVRFTMPVRRLGE